MYPPIHFLFFHLYNSVFVHPCSPPFTLHRPRSILFALFTLPQSRSPLLNVVYPCLPSFTLVQIRSPSFNPVHPLSPSFTFVHRISTSFTPAYFCSLLFNSTLPCFFLFYLFFAFFTSYIESYNTSYYTKESNPFILVRCCSPLFTLINLNRLRKLAII